MKKYKGLIILISLILFVILSYIGLFIIAFNDETNLFLAILYQVIGLIITFPVFVAVHEAGHMVFGLISGYSLLSYKVGPFEWYKSDDKIKFRILPLNAIVLGQCLMSPPKPKKKIKPKFHLYNAGGLIFSYLMDIIVIVLFILLINYDICFMFIPIISISLFLTINNSIYQPGGINDVCNYVLVKNNPKYIDSILYQLEMITNITNGKRYGAKTLYTPYYEEKLNHISLAVVQFRFYQLIDKDDFEEAKKLAKIMRKNIQRIPFVLQRAAILLDILYADLVLDENMANFKRHFTWIRDTERMVYSNSYYGLTPLYNIYSYIYNGVYHVEDHIKEFLESDILSSGEKLSMQKRLNYLNEVLYKLEEVVFYENL